MFDIVDDLDSNKWEQKEAPANYDADKASKYLIIRPSLATILQYLVCANILDGIKVI